MGYALAETLAEKGAEVMLISGPVSIKPKHKNIKPIFVESAKDMFIAAEKEFSECNIAIFAAAVSDYSVENTSGKKIKKKSDNLILKLSPSIDIAAEFGKQKRENQITVGFALETDNEIQNAKKKIKNKNFDFIVLNSLKDKGAGFAFDTNKVSIIDKYNNIERYELKSKKEVAEDIVNKILELIPKIQ